MSNLFDSKTASSALTVLAGPCAAESLDLCREVAEFLKNLSSKFPINLVFKASFDKANRTSIDSYRGPGIEEGLSTLSTIRAEFDLPVITDIHEPTQAEHIAKEVDALQIPAFLCRQTDLLLAAGATGKPTLVKKGQFLAPEDMQHVVNKFRSDPNAGPVAVCERGSSFGYHNLVVDMRSLVIMRERCEAPVIFDATHSVQRPSADGGRSAGDRRLAPVLARAAAAVGIDGLFAEVHPNPDKAKSDGPNSLDFSGFENMIREIIILRKALSQE